MSNEVETDFAQPKDGESHTERRPVGKPPIARAVVICLLALGYIALWEVAAMTTSSKPSDLDLYFWPSAEVAVHGHPFLLYSASGLARYPNANGPLGVVPLLPAAAIANAVGWEGSLEHRAELTDAAAAVLALLLAAAAGRLVWHAGVSRASWTVAMLAVLLGPALWVSALDYGHLEQIMGVGFVLIGAGLLADGRSTSVGLVLGLAALTRTTSALYILPFTTALVWSRRYFAAARQLSMLLVTVAVGLLPFYLSDPSDVTCSLFTYRSLLPIAGGSVWVLAAGSPIATLIRQYDLYLVAAVSIALCALVAYRNPPRVMALDGLLGLLTVTAAVFPMLAKTVYPYYLLEPYVFACAWWLARPGRIVNWRLVVPFLLTADVLVAKWGETLPLTGLGAVEGVASSAILAVVIILVVSDSSRASCAFEPVGEATGNRRRSVQPVVRLFTRARARRRSPAPSLQAARAGPRRMDV